jgi:ABC-type transport system substrate-binding protein
MIRKIGLSIAICPLLFILCPLALQISGGGAEQKKPVYGGVFRMKSVDDTFRMQLDPAHPDSHIFLSEQLYDGLVRLDKNLKIAPSLADYWLISADGRKYTFFLKKGVLFHHGEELTARDVKFSLERLLGREANSPYRHFFLSRIAGAAEFSEGKAEEISGIEVIDRYTLAIHWIRPYVPALYLLSMHFCKILPQDRVVRQGNSFFLRPVGTGPFMFDYWVRDNRLNEVGVRLIRNENYFQQMPYLEALEYCPLYTLDHFIRGEIDCIPVLSDRLSPSKYRIFHDGSLQTAFLGISCHIPPFDNPAVRKAIQAGIDKQAIAKAVHDVKYLRQVTNRFIPSRIPGFVAVDETNTFDREEAKRLLAEAGYSSENRFPTIVLYLDSPRSDYKHKFFREITDQLGALGIETDVNYFRSLDQVKQSENPYLILVQKMMGMPDPEDMIRPLFSAQSDSNLFGYINSSIEDMLLSSEEVKSWSKRIRLFQQIEKILLEDVPAIPIYTQQNRVATQPYVRGVAVPRLGMYYLDAKKIWLEK